MKYDAFLALFSGHIPHECRGFAPATSDVTEGRSSGHDHLESHLKIRVTPSSGLMLRKTENGISL